MNGIWKYKTVKIIIGILIPAALGFYQSKLNSLENILKYGVVTFEQELIKVETFQDIMLLKVIGYITFFIAIGLFLRFVWNASYYKSKNN